MVQRKRHFSNLARPTRLSKFTLQKHLPTQFIAANSLYTFCVHSLVHRQYLYTWYSLSLSLSFATNWFVLIFMTCICFAGLKTLDCLLPSFSLCVCAIVCAVAFKAPPKRRFFILYLCPCLSFFICLYLFRAALRVLTERKRVLRESSGCYRLYYYKHRLD